MSIVHRILAAIYSRGFKCHDEEVLIEELERLILEEAWQLQLEQQRHRTEEEYLRRKLHQKHLGFTFSANGLTIKGDHMTFTMPPLTAAGQPTTVTVIGSPVTADGSTSKATLSGTSYSSSDSTVFTVADDPAVPGGAIITAVAAPAAGTSASATLTETAVATEEDGTTTEKISGTATIILFAPVPAPAPAAAITFTFGTPSA